MQIRSQRSGVGAGIRVSKGLPGDTVHGTPHRLKTASKGLEARSCFSLDLCSPVKNVFITEAETVSAGEMLLLRDVAQQQVGDHTEKQWV